MSVPCFDCNVSCCSAYSVLVNAADVARIETALGVPSESFLEPEPVDEGNQDYAEFSFTLGDQRRYLLRLQRRDSDCVFLLQIGNRGRCGIHAIRPGVCRCYPFTFGEGGGVVEVEHHLCPRRWHLDAGQTAGFAEALARYQEDYDQHRAVVSRWDAEIGGRLGAASSGGPAALGPARTAGAVATGAALGAGFTAFLTYLRESLPGRSPGSPA